MGSGELFVMTTGIQMTRDRISIFIIKQSIQIIADRLAHIINLSITHGIVPDQMKVARVIPLFTGQLGLILIRGL